MTLVSLFHPWGNFENVVEAANCAEEHGFYGCLFGEHHGSPMNERPQLMVLLGALAGRTNRIRLGTSILLSPLVHPVHLAEQASVVDVLSNGRLLLGLGLGYQPQDFRQFGIPFKQRVSHFEEGIEVLRRAWTQERFSYHGRRYQLDDIAVYPRPAQSPHPPIWLAAWSTEGAKRAGRLGDAYVTDPIQNLAATKAFADAYRTAAADSDRPTEVILMREFCVAESRQEALDRYSEGILLTYRYYWENNGFNKDYEAWMKNVSSPSDLNWDMLAKDRVIWGTPEDCVGQLEHWINELDASHVQLVIPTRGEGMNQERQLDTIKFTGERVVPKVNVI